MSSSSSSSSYRSGEPHARAQLMTPAQLVSGFDPAVSDLFVPLPSPLPIPPPAYITPLSAPSSAESSSYETSIPPTKKRSAPTPTAKLPYDSVESDVGPLREYNGGAGTVSDDTEGFQQSKDLTPQYQRKYPLAVRRGYVGGYTPKTNVTYTPDGNCRKRLLYLLFDTLEDVFRCFVLVFNNTSHAIDPVVASYTASYMGKSIDAKTKSATYFSVKSIPFAMGHGMFSSYSPMQLNLPYVNKTNYQDIKMETTFTRAELFSRNDYIMMLFYAYLSMVLDIYVYMLYAHGKYNRSSSTSSSSSTPPLPIPLLVSVLNGCNNDKYFRDVVLLLHRQYLYLTNVRNSKTPRDPKEVYKAFQAFSTDAPFEEGDLWVYFLKIDTSFVRLVEAFFLDYSNILACQHNEKDLQIIKDHRATVQSISSDLSGAGGYFLGMQELGTMMIANFKVVRKRTWTPEDKKLLEKNAQSVLLQIGARINDAIRGRASQAGVDTYADSAISTGIYELMRSLITNKEIKNALASSDIDPNDRNEIARVLFIGMKKLDLDVLFRKVMTDVKEKTQDEVLLANPEVVKGYVNAMEGYVRSRKTG